MKAAANLSLLWAELPYLDRFDAASSEGFTAVEVLSPYDMPAKETQRALMRGGLEMVLINAPPPNYTGGERGYAALPGGEHRFQHDMRRAFRYVEALKVPLLHVMAGDTKDPAARDTMIENMRWAAREAPEGLTLTIEPLCDMARPGYFLDDYALAAEILRDVDAPNVGLQFDSYHAQMIHGDAIEVFRQYQPLVRHIQIGDAPERGVPGTGEIDFEALLEVIRESGYRGWISGEYHPGKKVSDGLAWMKML